MSDYVINEFYSDDRVDKAVVLKNDRNQYAVDFYKNGNYTFSALYPDKSLNYVEDAAKEYVVGLFDRKLNDF